MDHPRFLALLIGTAFALVGCDARRSSQIEQVTLQERVLPRPNPRSYEFAANTSDTKIAIQKSYDDWHYATSKKYGEQVWQGDGDAVTKRVYSQALQLIGHEQLLWKGDADALANGLLNMPGNEDDAYLYGGDAPYSESEVYFKDDLPLIYYADFHIHLTALSATRTRLEILTYGSKVAVGADKNFSPVRGPGLKLLDVVPTTVEEYEILLRVGIKLGATDMPPLGTPGSNAPVRQVIGQLPSGS